MSPLGAPSGPLAYESPPSSSGQCLPSRDYDQPRKSPGRARAGGRVPAPANDLSSGGWSPTSFPRSHSHLAPSTGKIPSVLADEMNFRDGYAPGGTSWTTARGTSSGRAQSMRHVVRWSRRDVRGAPDRWSRRAASHLGAPAGPDTGSAPWRGSNTLEDCREGLPGELPHEPLPHPCGGGCCTRCRDGRPPQRAEFRG